MALLPSGTPGGAGVTSQQGKTFCSEYEGGPPLTVLSASHLKEGFVYGLISLEFTVTAAVIGQSVIR